MALIPPKKTNPLTKMLAAENVWWWRPCTVPKDRQRRPCHLLAHSVICRVISKLARASLAGYHAPLRRLCPSPLSLAGWRELRNSLSAEVVRNRTAPTCPPAHLLTRIYRIASARMNFEAWSVSTTHARGLARR